MYARPNTPKRILAAATAGFILLTGCWQDPSSGDDRSTAGATIEGQVMGGLALAKMASAGIEGATVTAVRLKADGSFETVSKGEVKTDAEGRFLLETTAETAQGIMVVAKKEAKEFKAVVSGELKEGAKVLCRPLDVESSVEAEVFAKVHADGKADEVSFADIAAHIDAAVAMKAEGKAEATGFLAAQLATEAETRASVLLSSTVKATRAQIEKMDEARIEAQADLEAKLHAAAKAGAGLAAAAKAKAEEECLKAHLEASSAAGIAVGDLAKAREAAFQAMVKAQAEAASEFKIEAETRLAWTKRIALHHAHTLEAALKADIEAAGGNASFVAGAGAALKASLAAAKTEADIDTAFAKCRGAVGLGIKSSLEGALGTAVLLPETSSARAAFEASLKSAVTAEAVAEAYVKFFADAEAEIKALLVSGPTGTGSDAGTDGGGKAAALDAAKLQAATRAVLLADVQGHAVTVKPSGFSLSGKVEGGIEGADVKLATVKADGSLELVSSVEAMTGSDGSFVLKTDAPIPGNAVVVVTKDSSTLTALVDARTDSVKVGTETTVETQVWQKAVIEGKTEITPADVKVQVDSQVAATLKADAGLAADLIASLDAAAKAEASFLAEGGAGLATSSLLLITSARAAAKGRLEAELKTAGGDAAKVKAAYEAYHEAVMEAYAKAGLDAAAYARSQQVYAQALVKASVKFSGEARATLIRSGHSQAVRGLRSAMEITMKASGATDAVLKAAVEAGLALQAAVDASAKVETIEAAYASYHAAILSCLKGAFLLHAEAIGEVDGSIRSAAGARAALMAAVKGEASSDALSKAHVSFAAAVEAQVSSAFKGGLAAPSAAHLKVITQALALVNMCG